MRKKINWGILGCASIARNRVLPGMVQAENAGLYAVASRGDQKLREFCELFPFEKSYDNYEKLLEDQNVDAVYIPLPNSLHYEWVKKAAQAGKHILCEKPMALSRQQAEEMFQICEKEGVIIMEAFAYRHAPLIQQVKKILDQGTIGAVKYLESHLTDVLTDMGNIRMNQALGGGAFYDMACYNISAISYLLDFRKPEKVKAFAEMDPKYKVDVSNTALLFYADGVQAVSYSSLNSYPRGYYAIVGEKGRIEVPCNFNCRYVQKFTITVDGIVSNVEILDEKRTEYTVMCPDNYKLEIEQFGRCILEGESPIISKEETLLNAEILDRVLESAGQ